MSYQCYTDDYNYFSKALIIPFILIWVLIFPGVLFLMVYLNKEKRLNPTIVARYGYLYLGKFYLFNLFNVTLL